MQNVPKLSYRVTTVLNCGVGGELGRWVQAVIRTDRLIQRKASKLSFAIRSKEHHTNNILHYNSTMHAFCNSFLMYSFVLMANIQHMCCTVPETKQNTTIKTRTKITTLQKDCSILELQ